MIRYCTRKYWLAGSPAWFPLPLLRGWEALKSLILMRLCLGRVLRNVFVVQTGDLQPWAATSASSVAVLGTGPGSAPPGWAVAVAWGAVAEVSAACAALLVCTAHLCLLSVLRKQPLADPSENVETQIGNKNQGNLPLRKSLALRVKLMCQFSLWSILKSILNLILTPAFSLLPISSRLPVHVFVSAGYLLPLWWVWPSCQGLWPSGGW